MTNPESPDVKLTQYYPGAIGQITELHAAYYHEHWGFDLSFETQVARELSEFLLRFRNDRDGFWVAQVNSGFAGAAAIDGSLGESEGARLRWFIVDPQFHGFGIGALLLQQTIDFCERAGHKRVFLWTFKGLDQARKLYERQGFRLCEENLVDQWGSSIAEQKYELTL